MVARFQPSGRDIRHQSGHVLPLALLLAGLFALYGPLNHGPARWTPKTPLDARIPLIEPFVVPYLSIFVVAAVTLLAFLRKSVLIAQSALLSTVLTLAVAYLVYAFAQTHVSRPVVTGHDVFARLLRLIYDSDGAYNCFPSLHAALATVIGIHWMWFRPRIGGYVVAWCGLITLSTIFVHQHYIADMIGGILLASCASLVARRLTGRQFRRGVTAVTADDDG